MAKKGIMWSATTWLILALVLVLVALLLIGLSSGKMKFLLDVAHDVARFGG